MMFLYLMMHCYEVISCSYLVRIKVLLRLYVICLAVSCRYWINGAINCNGNMSLSHIYITQKLSISTSTLHRDHVYRFLYHLVPLDGSHLAQSRVFGLLGSISSYPLHSVVLGYDSKLPLRSYWVHMFHLSVPHHTHRSQPGVHQHRQCLQCLNLFKSLSHIP